MREVIAHVQFNIAPLLADGFESGKFVGGVRFGIRLIRRASAPATAPDPFDRDEMRERISHGRKAAAHRTQELLRRELLARGQLRVARPVVVFEHFAQCVERNQFLPRYAEFIEVCRNPLPTGR